MDPGQSQPKVTKANLSGIIRQINRKSPEVVTFGSLSARETSVLPEFKSTRFFIIFIPKICSVSSLKAQIKDSDYREPSEYSSKKIYFESHHLAAVWLFLYV